MMMKILLATLEDVPQIHNILIQNLFDVKTTENLTEERRQLFEESGFLRKEVPERFYSELISNEDSTIFVVKNDKSQILGFASIYPRKSNVYDFRSSLVNLFGETSEIEDFLTMPDSEFLYLDQIAVLPEYRRNGIASKLFETTLSSTHFPIVAFVVTKPLMNKASIQWHKNNGFEYAGRADGSYKGIILEWDIYIHWN